MGHVLVCDGGGAGVADRDRGGHWKGGSVWAGTRGSDLALSGPDSSGVHSGHDPAGYRVVVRAQIDLGLHVDRGGRRRLRQRPARDDRALAKSGNPEIGVTEATETRCSPSREKTEAGGAAYTRALGGLFLRGGNPVIRPWPGVIAAG